jgi:hypothetical protein
MGSFLFSCTARKSESLKFETVSDSLTQKKNDTVRVNLANTVVKEFTSKFTKQPYDIYVSYPADYLRSGKNYPVLMVLDAEVNFGAVSYIVQRLVKDGLIPEIFVIGIAYRAETDEHAYYSIRCRDFTPSVDEGFLKAHPEYKSGAGRAEDFVKFISLELLPYVESHYPIRKVDRALYGHSFGGLFGVHVLLHHPELFDNYLLLSPSLWWNDQNTLKEARTNGVIAAKSVRLYMATGEMEDHMADDQVEIAGLFKRSNTSDFKMKSEILDNETHRTIFGRGFTNGLRFLMEK